MHSCPAFINFIRFAAVPSHPVYIPCTDRVCLPHASCVTHCQPTALHRVWFQYLHGSPGYHQPCLQIHLLIQHPVSTAASWAVFTACVCSVGNWMLATFLHLTGLLYHMMHLCPCQTLPKWSIFAYFGSDLDDFLFFAQGSSWSS